MARSAHPSVRRSKPQPADPRLAIPELEARIEASRGSFKHSVEIQERVRSRGEPMKEHQLFFPAQDLAKEAGCLCALGRWPEAKAAFLEGSRFSEEGAFYGGRLRRGALGGAIQDAILAGERERALRLVHRERPPLLEEGRTLSFYLAEEPLLTGDEAGLRRVIEEAREYERTHEAGFPGYWDAVEALLQGSADAFAAGIAKVLEKHGVLTRVHNSFLYNAADALLCRSATALAILAAWRGIRLPADLPGRRKVVRWPLIDLTEFDGKPLERDTKFELEADFIPPGLLPE